MSLAARCPACGTVFRVVQDQLRVSEGWVRCGRCTEVFNAIANLVDLEADLPAPPAPRRAESAAASPGRGVGGAGQGGRPAPAAIERPPAPAATAPTAPPAPSPAHEPAPAVPTQAADMPMFESTPAPSPPAEAAAAPAASADAFRPSAAETPAAAAAKPAAGEAAAQAADLRAPPFVRRAERAAHWRRPAVRAGLAGLAVAAAAVLVLQIGMSYRDGIAARWPALRPALEALCAGASCRVEAPRGIESLAVESSGLVRIEGTAMYRLSVVLANRSPSVLAAPALDLTLTDMRGDVIARRALTPGEMGLMATSLPGRSQQAVQATLQVADRQVSGYTIEIFYP